MTVLSLFMAASLTVGCDSKDGGTDGVNVNTGLTLADADADADGSPTLMPTRTPMRMLTRTPFGC